MKRIIITSLTLGLFASAYAAEYTATKYESYMDTANSTFTATSSIYFYAGWKSSSDTVTTTGNLDLQGKGYTYDITETNITTQALYLQWAKHNITNSEITAKSGIYAQEGADSVIENSTLNISDRIYVQRNSAKLHIKNSTTTLNASSMSQVVDASSLSFEGGIFTVNGSQKINLKQGSTITFKDMTVDFGNSSISTSTDSKNKDVSAKIVIDNTTFTGLALDLYGYEVAGAMPTLEIKNGSTVTTNIASYYSTIRLKGMRGGTITVSGNSTLNLASDLEQEEQNDNQIYTSNIIVTGGSTVNVDGDVSLNSVDIRNGTINADNITTKDLIVSEDSKIILASSETANLNDSSLSENGKLIYENLELIVSDVLAEGFELDLNDILSENLGVVLSAIEDNEQIIIGNGTNKFNATVNENRVALIGAAIPEPSTYAVIFGALALGFAIYRRRK